MTRRPLPVRARARVLALGVGSATGGRTPVVFGRPGVGKAKKPGPARFPGGLAIRPTCWAS